MKYTMKRNRDTITLDTETGNITGGTYGMRDIIKSEFTATWNKDGKCWHIDNLADEINSQIDRLKRLYWLAAVEEVTPVSTPATNAEKTAETTTVKNAFIARMTRPCPKCGTYCYGDCSYR